MKINCAYTKLVPLHELKQHPKNRNKHNKEQIHRLAKILSYQGWRSPIKVSNRSGCITSGHGRLMTAVYLGWIEAPVDFQDYESDEQEYADVIADNEIARWAELDLAGVNLDLKDLGPDFDLDLLGINGFELDILPSEPLTDEDAVPEHVEPKAKLGDIYQLGRHRLMCGDSCSIDAAETLMVGNTAAMVFTDPPYGINYQSNSRLDKFAVIENDHTFLSEWVNFLPVVSKGWVFVWTTWKVFKEWIDITSSIGEMSNVVIWDKGGGGIGDLKGTFSTDYEVALVFNRGAEITGKRLGSVWSIGRDRADGYLHHTQKPVELAQMALENCTKSGDIVLDLFGGSGSTLIACEKTNRRCFMMELDPKYIDVIVARWEAYTGQKAELINGQA